MDRSSSQFYALSVVASATAAVCEIGRRRHKYCSLFANAQMHDGAERPMSIASCSMIATRNVFIDWRLSPVIRQRHRRPSPALSAVGDVICHGGRVSRDVGGGRWSRVWPGEEGREVRRLNQRLAIRVRFKRS